MLTLGMLFIIELISLIGIQWRRCTEDVNECKNNPCRNGGHCANSPGSYVCTCQPGYSGHNCQTDVDDCSPSDNSSKRGTQQYSWTFSICFQSNVSLSPSSDPCLNGGSCVDNVGGFACECRPGFQGGRCETEIDECASQPCWNGANCRDYVNSFVCECRAVMLFFFLILSPCSSCLNNGTCIDDINTFSCRCRPGFYGTFCEYEQNECDSQPCKNGGTCADGLGTYRCTCPVGYNGQNCQACGWDGLDCATDTPAKVIEGTLVIVVRLQPKELIKDLRGFLRSLGALLHTNLKVKEDENKDPMVYPYYGPEDGHGRLLQRGKSKREMEREVIG
uniref:EGF-like domain-containing protein n=1 Tax=Hippocampus comes TaxID=109280 RepID=A0A3Q2ZCT3_HIPCM